MLINGVKLEIDELIGEINTDDSMIKMRGNGIYLSDKQIEILKKYNIDYGKYASLSSLIFDIEQVLNEETDTQDLEELSQKLAELNYYNYTKK